MWETTKIKLAALMIAARATKTYKTGVNFDCKGYGKCDIPI